MTRGYYEHRLWHWLLCLPMRLWCPLVHRDMHKLMDGRPDRWACRQCHRQWAQARW
jgi:hypothetical protein